TFSHGDRPWHGSPWLFYDDTNSNAGSRGPSDEHRDTFKFVVLATGLRRRDVAWPSSKNLFVDGTRAAPRKRIRTSTWPSCTSRTRVGLSVSPRNTWSKSRSTTG